MAENSTSDFGRSLIASRLFSAETFAFGAEVSALTDSGEMTNALRWLLGRHVFKRNELRNLRLSTSDARLSVDADWR